MLHVYDKEKKYCEKIMELEKKLSEVNCLSMNGEVDQGILAIRGSTVESLMAEKAS